MSLEEIMKSDYIKGLLDDAAKEYEFRKSLGLSIPFNIGSEDDLLHKRMSIKLECDDKSNTCTSVKCVVKGAENGDKNN